MFHPFPVLETSRLRLRIFTAADAPAMHIMRSDPEVMRFIPRPLTTSEADALAFIQLLNDYTANGERIHWAIEWKETGDMVGLIGFVAFQPEHFRAEVGYSLIRAWYRKGIMREALLCVLHYGFEQLGLHSIEAIADAENLPSCALLTACGFRQEALFREDFYWNGAFRNSAHFGLLKQDVLPIC